jgi:hypothetical protein
MTAGNANTRPNFFVLLDLNPDAPWSDAVYQKALADKRDQWGRDSTAGISPRDLVAQGKIRLIPEIKKVMGDPVLRAIEAAAARTELARKQNQRLDDFERALAFINVRTSIEQAELDKFIEAYKDIMTAQQIKDRITIPVRAGGGSPPLAPQLDPVMAKNIADRLEILHLASLYELLGAGTDKLSVAQLCDLADKLFLETVRRAHTEEDTVKKELAGYAKDVFKSEESRKKYDETLRLTSLNALLKKLDGIMSHVNKKEVQVGQVALFLEEAQKAGWSRTEALSRLQEHARDRKWSLEVPAIDPRSEKICCGLCKHLNDRGQNFCSACKEALSFDCPDCGHKVSCESIACGSCGFPVGNRYRVKFLLEESDLLLKKGDLEGAEKVLSEAESAWRPKKAEVLAQKISAFRTTIDTKKLTDIKKQKEVSEQCVRLVGEKKLFATRALLLSSKDVIFPDREMYGRAADEGIAQAQALLKQAHAVSTSVDERIGLCRQALLICADYKEARELLAITPPSAPENLRARVKGKVVSLSWDPVPIQGVTYHIIRKSRAQPNSIQDGKELPTVTGHSYDDTTAEVGLPLYYAVFSECEQVLSQESALLPHSVLLTQEVTRLVAKVGERRVDLSWEPPSNVFAVCIVRKEDKPPVSLNDGTLLAKLDRKQKRFLDQDVENERVYHYALYCQFKDQDGHVITSYGQHVMASPEAPPQPITNIDIKETKTEQALELLISWQRPQKGNVVILKSLQKPALRVGDIIMESDLSQFGQLLEDRPESVKDTWTVSGIAYYTPVVLAQKWACIGVTRRHVWVENVGNFRHQNLGSTIRLYWTWPEQCQEVIVAHSPQDWPEAGNPLTITRHVSRATYDQLGYYDIKGTINQNYYITVSAVIKQGDDYIPAQPLRIIGRIISKMVFNYDIKSPTFFQKKHLLQIVPKTSGTLPALLLIGKRQSLPISRTDGELLHRIEPMIINGEKVVIALPEKTFPSNTFGKLFLEDDRAYESVTINHPDAQNLRLG